MTVIHTAQQIVINEVVHAIANQMSLEIAVISVAKELLDFPSLIHSAVLNVSVQEQHEAAQRVSIIVMKFHSLFTMKPIAFHSLTAKEITSYPLSLMSTFQKMKLIIPLMTTHTSTIGIFPIDLEAI